VHLILRARGSLGATSTPRRAILVPLAAAALAVLAAVLAVRALDVSPHRITSNSMAPGIERGDLVVVTGRDGAVARGDAVLFRYPPGSSGRAVKRAVAVGGDTVSLTERAVVVNGRAIAVRPLPGEPAPRRELRVPDGHVFLLGDNSAVSIDSRSFGTVPEQEVVARVRLTIPSQWVLLGAAAGAVAVGAAAALGLRRRV
jgi:signal peptidase I